VVSFLSSPPLVLLSVPFVQVVTFVPFTTVVLQSIVPFISVELPSVVLLLTSVPLVVSLCSPSQTIGPLN
jgi:hypothetical protein